MTRKRVLTPTDKLGMRRRNLERKYGLTLEEFEALMALQGEFCAVCQDRPATHVDHDHVTERVRGILCHRCNTILGMAGDSVWVLSQAISYLTEHRR